MLTKQQRRLLKKLELERDVKILRQVVYKELMEWRRKLYQPDNKLNVEGEIRKTMALTEADKKFIDEQIRYFLFAEIPDEILLESGKTTLDDVKSTPNPSLAQKQLRANLENALTLDKPPAEDLPF